MPQHFLDSSALLKRYREEVGSQWMLELSNNSDRIIVARLAHVEVTAAVVRRSREASESSQNAVLALAALDGDMRNEFQVVEFSEALISRAIQLAKAHALRAADAIQLACGLVAQSALPAATEFYFVSADEQLNVAAIAEGLRVENPNLYP
jgi:predicted nucleic acid-binding protein